MLGAGTVINPIIKIVTTVVILGAVYLFIIKPTLDTTNDVFDQSFGAFDDLSGNIQDEVNDSLDSLNQSDAAALQRCIENAVQNGPNQDRVQHCLDRFGS
jgi:hypothetical protein